MAANSANWGGAVSVYDSSVVIATQSLMASQNDDLKLANQK